jgi:hypothetical protein
MTMITSQMREPEISRTQEMAVSISQDGGRPIANSCVRSTTSARLGRRSSMKSGQSRPTRSATCSSGSSRIKAARLAALRSPRSPWSDVHSCEPSLTRVPTLSFAKTSSTPNALSDAAWEALEPARGGADADDRERCSL